MNVYCRKYIPILKNSIITSIIKDIFSFLHYHIMIMILPLQVRFKNKINNSILICETIYYIDRI